MKINSYVCCCGGTEEILNQIKRAGFDRAVLAGYPDGILLNGKRLPDRANERIAEAVRKYPETFLGCGYINPMEQNALAQLEQWKRQGFQAVKIIPADGYHLDDKSLYPFFEKAEQLGFVMYVDASLCTFTYENAAAERKAPNSFYNQPMKLDPVSRLFPNMTFVLLNMGFPLMNEAWSIHHNSKNVYLHLGEEGMLTSGPSIGYANMGAGGFIPLDETRILFGSGFAADLLHTATVGESYFHIMGLDWCKAAQTNPQKLFKEQGDKNDVY